MSVYTNVLAFWKEFEEKDATLRQNLVEDQDQAFAMMEKYDEKINQICGSHFFCEFTYDAFEMTFDTGPNKTSQYLAWYCAQLAPQSIQKNWIINSCLPPMSQKAIQADLKIKEDDYYLNDFTVFYTVDQKNQTIDCKLYCPGYSQIGNDERKKEMSMYLIELALGQCAYEAYLSSVDCLDTPDETMKFCNLIDFYEAIMETVEKHNWHTYNHPTEIYSMYQPYKEFADDSLRKDMKMIFTTHPLLVEETIEQKQDVLSDLLVKDGEFGYMYFMNLYNNKEDALFRQELSKKLDKEMTKIHAAKVIGGAIGKSYCYIDWIVFDKHRFIQAFNDIKKQLDIKLYYQKF